MILTCRFIETRQWYRITSTRSSYRANMNINLTVRLTYFTPYNLGFSLRCRACRYMRQYRSHLREIDTHPEWYLISQVRRFIWCWCSGRAFISDCWRWGKRESFGRPLPSLWWTHSKRDNFAACKYEFMCARDVAYRGCLLEGPLIT